MDDEERHLRIRVTELFRTEVRSICLNSEYADVVFIVEGERLPAHRVILAARSPYFRALLSANWENRREVELEVPVLPFRQILFYLYSGQVSIPLGPKMCDAMLGVLELANEYLLSELMNALASALSQNYSLTNVIDLLMAGKTYNQRDLILGYYSFVERNAKDFVLMDSAKYLPMDVLIETISRDTFCAAEIDILRMALRWNQHNNRHDPYGNLMPILSKIRFCHTCDVELRRVTTDPTMLAKLRTSSRELSPQLPRRYLLWQNEPIPQIGQPIGGINPYVTFIDFAMINYVEITIDRLNAPIKVQLADEWTTVRELDSYCNPTATLEFPPVAVRSIHINSEARQINILKVVAMYKVTLPKFTRSSSLYNIV